MKANKIHQIILGFSCLALVTGCVNESIQNNPGAADGDEIQFGVRAGFENSDPDTKTVYSGETYVVDGHKFERIDWLDKPASPQDGDIWDMIEIYCEQASNGPRSHYEINDAATAGEKNDFAYLTRIGNSSLQWNGDGEHVFYAMYPSSKLFENLGDNNTLLQGVKMDGSTLNGIIPASQNPLSISQDANGNYVVAPDMRYAYMAAKNTATREDGSVSLNFVPIVTAVQIELELPTSVSDGTGEVKPLSIGEIQVQGTGIAGGFTADLGTWTGTYPTCANLSGGSDIIQISTWQKGSDGNLSPLVIEAGKTLTFTVFLRPGADVKDLKVSISETGASYVSKALNGISIPKNLKTVISNLYLPATGIEIDASKWMSQLDQQTTMKKLSLPGTGGSFSAGYTDTGSDSKYYKSQTLTFEQQWNLGIRAFEIISNRPSSTTTSLGEQDVTCNKTSVSTQVKTVMESLFNKVTAEGSSECAVAILSYQPGGDGASNRNASGYASSLKVWYDGLTADQKSIMIPYSPDLTLEHAKNHVLVIVRLNQRDEPEADLNGRNKSIATAESNFQTALTTLKDCPFLIVNGCGTAKDHWKARGYTVKSSDGTSALAPDISNAYSKSGQILTGYTAEDSTVEKYMFDGFIDPRNHSNVSIPSMNFGYDTNNENVTCWYQEWARVVPSQMQYTNSGFMYKQQFYWFESYNEKLSNVTGTFDMAISDKYSNYVFINSLCGYLTDTNFENSIKPSLGNDYGGDGGDIQGLADKLNPAFYQHVLNCGLEQTTGPTGIVLMDYVSNDSSAGGSYYLPGVIIANNFKFGSGNGSSSGGSGSSGSGETGGEGGTGDGI
ncbi:MAG: hypothetical protein ACI3ZC_08200 [Candidatus Cryptobacteroides sp.]